MLFMRFFQRMMEKKFVFNENWAFFVLFFHLKTKFLLLVAPIIC